MIASLLPPLIAPALLIGASPVSVSPVLNLETPAAIESVPTPALPSGASQSTGGDEEIVVSGRTHGAAVDPLRAVNETSFAATVAVDGAVARPVALAYARTVPAPLRQGLRNALDNLAEPVSFVNYLLQLKPVSALKTVARFTLNSTVGLAGVINVAKGHPFDLKRRRNGFADTLGFYGVKPGVFFYMPLIGPTTIRDLAGGFLDRAFLPAAIGNPFDRAVYTVPVGILSAVDRRGRNDETIQLLHEQADPYLASRRAYLDRRQARIDALKNGED